MLDARRILIVAIALAGAGLALADTPPVPSAAGHWEGAITLPSGDLAIVADLAEEAGEAGSKWKGEADVPQQGIRNLAVSNLSVAGSDVTFALPGIPGTPTFNGKLSPDGATISGSFVQGGQTLPFRLERKGTAEFGVVPDGVKLVERGKPGEGAAGEWHGVLEVGPHKLRLIATITNANGTLAGMLESVDQGGQKVPLANVAYGAGERTLAFEVPDVGGSFSGKLGADGAEATGQWSQGGPAVPLTFKRAG